MYVVPRNTARGLNDKRTEEGKKESVGAEQPLRVACSQEKAYEALEWQRRDGVARNGIGCTFMPRATDEPWHIVHLALFCMTGSRFHCLLVYKIPSQLSSAMTVVDMSRINFYQSPSASSSCFSLKPSNLSNTGGKRTMILERDWWEKPFTTNRKIEHLFQTQMAEDIKAEDEDIVETQRHEKFI